MQQNLCASQAKFVREHGGNVCPAKREQAMRPEAGVGFGGEDLVDADCCGTDADLRRRKKKAVAFGRP